MLLFAPVIVIDKQLNTNILLRFDYGSSFINAYMEIGEFLTLITSTNQIESN